MWMFQPTELHLHRTNSVICYIFPFTQLPAEWLLSCCFPESTWRPRWNNHLSRQTLLGGGNRVQLVQLTALSLYYWLTWVLRWRSPSQTGCCPKAWARGVSQHPSAGSLGWFGSAAPPEKCWHMQTLSRLHWDSATVEKEEDEIKTHESDLWHSAVWSNYSITPQLHQ